MKYLAILLIHIFIISVSHADNNHCHSLAELELPNTEITLAEVVPAGPFIMPKSPVLPEKTVDNIPEFCRVKGTVQPSIEFEVWMPSPKVWNGKFKAVGVGGLAGVIKYDDMISSVQLGYATASTDTGHKRKDDQGRVQTDWLRNPGLLRDYGYRGVHEMTLKSKKLIEAFYGKTADYSYFNGCSGGGRQAMMEAQRYPDDYDGIVAGAPAIHFIEIFYSALWTTLAGKPIDDNTTLLKPEDLKLVNQYILKQCDQLDGVTDGLLEDPRECRFDGAGLLCPDLETKADCLTIDQVNAIKKVYQGPKNSNTGRLLHYGFMLGSELMAGGWSWELASEAVPTQFNFFFSHAVKDGPAWDWRSFDFDKDVTLAMRRTGSMVQATDPNLDPFRSKGGKIIMYHGWNEQIIPPEASIDYYKTVADNLPMVTPSTAYRETADFFRLFMVPGMGHCGGGPGPNEFDAQLALEDWVERGIAPSKIIAKKRDGNKVVRSRPLCPYPKTAKYTGQGDINKAQNFRCVD